LMERLPTLAVPSRSMVKAEQKSQQTDLALVDLVAAVPQAAKAVLVDDKKASKITMK
jgi:hypothetical protein